MLDFVMKLDGPIELGLYALMALGVYITFRILDFPDLTVDGSFTTGARLRDSDYQRCESMARYAGAFAGGMFAGICTGCAPRVRSMACSQVLL